MFTIKFTQSPRTAVVLGLQQKVFPGVLNYET